MFRVLFSLLLVPSLLGFLWLVGSTVARLYYTAVLRAEYRRAAAAGRTAAADADAYVAENLPQLSRRAAILIGLVIVGLPAALAGSVIWTSMDH